MNDVKFPALVGDSPLAILAAIGTLRLIRDFVDDHALLSWDAADRAPVLHSSMPSVDDIVARLAQIIESMPEGVVVPGGPPGFPPPGGGARSSALGTGRATTFYRYALQGSVLGSNSAGMDFRSGNGPRCRSFGTWGDKPIRCAFREAVHGHNAAEAIGTGARYSGLPASGFGRLATCFGGHW